MTAILLVLTLIFAFLCYTSNRLGLFVLVATLPSYLLRLEVFGIPSTLLELFLVAYIGVWLIKNKSRILSLFRIPNILKLSLVLLCSAALVGVLVSPDATSALGILKAFFIEPIILFLILRLDLKERHLDPDSLFKAMGVSALILSGVACVQWVTQTGIPVPWDIERRVTSVFDYPNALGLFLGPIVVLSVVRLYQKTQWKFWLPIGVLSFLAIILAQSEAAIVAIFVSIFLAGLLHKKKWKITMITTLIVVVLIALSPWRSFVFEKLTLQDYSGNVRLSQWSETIEMLSDNWLFGAGLAGYPIALEPYHKAAHYEIFQYPHNILLNTWSEIGLLGVIACVILAMALTRPKHFLSLSAYSISFLLLIEMFIHGLVDVPYFKNDLAILTWILIAIVSSYACESTPQKNR